MHNLTYGEALLAVQTGQMIARASWGGSGDFVFQRPHDILPPAILPTVKSLPASVKELLAARGGDVLFSAYLCLHACGCIVNGWSPTQLDQQATDWRVLTPVDGTLTYSE